MSFSDPIDQGAHLADLHNQAAIAAHAAKMAPEQRKVPALDENQNPILNEDGTPILVWEQTECEDCGGPIEPARLEMARIRCVHCQGIKEKKEKQYASR